MFLVFFGTLQIEKKLKKITAEGGTLFFGLARTLIYQRFLKISEPL